MVTILYRVAGSPPVSTSGTFTDVAANAWYAKAVEWAAANNVVTGYPGNVFKPEQAITREQIATILYRAAGSPATTQNSLAGFPDAATVSSYATTSLNWAVEQGLINGIGVQGVSYLRPRNTATRAQIAAIIMRYLEP